VLQPVLFLLVLKHLFALPGKIPCTIDVISPPPVCFRSFFPFFCLPAKKPPVMLRAPNRNFLPSSNPPPLATPPPFADRAAATGVISCFTSWDDSSRSRCFTWKFGRGLFSFHLFQFCDVDPDFVFPLHCALGRCLLLRQEALAPFPPPQRLAAPTVYDALPFTLLSSDSSVLPPPPVRTQFFQPRPVHPFAPPFLPCDPH